MYPHVREAENNVSSYDYVTCPKRIVAVVMSQKDIRTQMQKSPTIPLESATVEQNHQSEKMCPCDGCTSPSLVCVSSLQSEPHAP